MQHDATIEFPCHGSGRPSTQTAVGILAASVTGVDDDLAADLRAARDWRTEYPRYYERLLVAEAQSSEAAMRVARQGLAAAREAFVVASPDGPDLPLECALASPGRLDTLQVRGADERVLELVVPYRGEHLRGLALLRALDEWVHRGITEPSFAEAIGAVVRNPDWLDLRDRTVALIGAAAEMGPLVQLLSWGARVAAVDLPGATRWERLVGLARESAGTLLVPLRPDEAGARDGGGAIDRAGIDLTRSVGPVLRWLAEQPGPMTVGNYGYADGAAFVRLTMAFDVMLTELANRRGDLSVAYLATPADAFLVPMPAVDMARRRHAEPSPMVVAGRAVHALSGGRWFKPNYPPGSLIETPTERFGSVSWFIPVQGPNYALAKRLQRWRMVAARGDGMVTSVHVAPPTRTRSVRHNPAMREDQLLTGLVGIETFDAATSEALAAAILVHDLRNPSAPANPRTPLGHPHEAFMFAANPGGRWRVPFDVGSSVPVLHDLRTIGPTVRRGLSAATGQAVTLARRRANRRARRAAPG